MEVYCQYFSDRLYGLGVPEQCPVARSQEREEDFKEISCCFLAGGREEGILLVCGVSHRPAHAECHCQLGGPQ